MNELKKISLRKNRRKRRIKSKIHGTNEKPRISIYKSNKYIYTQAIDDILGRTLISFSSFKDLKEGKCFETSKKLGSLLGEKLKEIDISTAVFDRNGYKFHGVVKGLVDGLRESGINI